jgi:hypothetical protein
VCERHIRHDALGYVENRSVALPTIYIIEVDKSVLIRLEQLDEDEERSFHHHAYTTPFEDRYSK